MQELGVTPDPRLPADIAAEIDAAVRFAKESPFPPASAMAEFTYAG